MRNGTGAIESIVLIGGTSEIGLACVRAFAQQDRLRRVVLVAREAAALDAVAAELRQAIPALDVELIVHDFASHPGGKTAVDQAFAGGTVDVVINAVGILGADIDCLTDVDAVAAMLRVNFDSVILTCTEAVQRLIGQGSGSLVVMSSVAAERPRADNYVYAATKAGIDAWASGLSDRLHGSGVSVTVVRPGFVHTKMTRGLAPMPMAVTADQVADVVVKAVRNRSQLVWAPPTVRPLMSALRHLPRPAFRKVTERAGKSRPGGKPSSSS